MRWLLFTGLLGMFLASGCGTLSTLAMAYKDGPALISCGSQEKDMVDKALTDGKVSVAGEVVDWLSFVATNLECVAPVVSDIIASFKSASPSASIDQRDWLAAVPSQEKLKRAHAALALCKSAGVCK